jgi:hypothetical protein
LFLENVKDGKYLSSDGTWKEVKRIHEKIKVRFGFDVEFDIEYTDNGVLLQKDLLHKDTGTFTLNLLPEMFVSDSELWDTDFMYSLALTNDPLTHHNLGPGEPFENYVQFSKMMRLYATKNEHN